MVSKFKSTTFVWGRSGKAWEIRWYLTLCLGSFLFYYKVFLYYFTEECIFIIRKNKVRNQKSKTSKIPSFIEMAIKGIWCIFFHTFTCMTCSICFKFKNRYSHVNQPLSMWNMAVHILFNLRKYLSFNIF